MSDTRKGTVIWFRVMVIYEVDVEILKHVSVKENDLRNEDIACVLGHSVLVFCG